MNNKLVQDLSRQVPNWNMNGVFLGPYHKSLEQFAALIIGEVCQHLTNTGQDHARELVEKQFGVE